MVFKVSNIAWETDNTDSYQVDLPTEVTVELDNDTDDIEMSLSDILSDKFGFLHNGFDYERMSNVSE